MVDEAATDVIASAQARGTALPWTTPSFIDEVAALQRQRQVDASRLDVPLQFHDRSVMCTAALADYLGHPRSAHLRGELARVTTESTFERRVFLVRPLGFITPTEARRISYQESLDFERIHERVYREFGFELVSIGPGPLLDRVASVKALAGVA